MHVTMLPEITAMSAEEYQDPNNFETEVESSQQLEANLLPEKIVYVTKVGEILHSLNVEKGRLREVALMSQHDMYELVQNADARGGAHVHTKLLQDEVGCRLVATQLAIGERVDVAQRTQ